MPAAGHCYQAKLTTRFTAPLTADPTGPCAPLLLAQRASYRAQLDRGWTPPLHSGLLPGIERARLVRSGVLREGMTRPKIIV